MYESIVCLFHIEFKIGRKKQQSVADDVLLKKKDELIATLRADLDDCRIHAKVFVDKLDEREKKDASLGRGAMLTQTVESDDSLKDEVSASASASSSSSKETIEQQLKMALGREDELKERLLALQSFAGVDFVPVTTKVSAATNTFYQYNLSLHPVDIPS